MFKLHRLTLKFEELPLHEAIRKVFEHPEFVRSEALLITDAGREWILQNVIVNLPLSHIGRYRFEHILLTVNHFRKLGKEALHKRLIVLEHEAPSKPFN